MPVYILGGIEILFGVHTICKTKLNYEKMNEMHNLACDFNCMVKIQGAGEVARKAMEVWDGWHSEHAKLRENSQPEHEVRQSRHA